MGRERHSWTERSRDDEWRSEEVGGRRWRQRKTEVGREMEYQTSVEADIKKVLMQKGKVMTEITKKMRRASRKYWG